MMNTKTKARILLALLLALPMGTRAAADILIGADTVSRFYFNAFTAANPSKAPKEFQVSQFVDGDHFEGLATFVLFADIEVDEDDSDGEGEQLVARAKRAKKLKMTVTAELWKVDGTQIPLGKFSVKGKVGRETEGFKVVDSSTAVVEDGDMIHWEVTKIKVPKIAPGGGVFFRMAVVRAEVFDD